MEQYIDKSALVAEIEKIYKFHEKRGNEHDSSICDVLYGLSHRIDTLEVKEVDSNDAFIEEVLDYIENNIYNHYDGNHEYGICSGYVKKEEFIEDFKKYLKGE